MEISNILYSSLKLSSDKSPAARKMPQKGQAKNTVSFPKDSVEISSSGKDKRLEMIKKKVQSGFYSSNQVRDDVAEKLSNVMDQMFK